MYKIFRVTFIVTFLSVFSSLINFLLNIYITRHYRIEIVSDYMLISSLLNIFSIAIIFGLDHCILRELPLKDPMGSTRFVGKVNFIHSIAIVFFGIVFMAWLAVKGFNSRTLILSFATLVIMGSSFIRKAICVAKGRVQLVQIYDKVVRVFIFAGTLLGCTFLIGPQLESILFALLVSYTVSGGLVSLVINRCGIKYWYISAKGDSDILKGALFLFLATIFTAALGQMDVIFINAWLPKGQTALYGVAHRFSLTGAIMLYSMNIVVLPMLVKAKADQNASQAVIRASLIVGTISSLFYFLVVYFFGQYLLSLFGMYYTEAYLVLVLLSVGQFINAIFGQTMTLMKIHGQEVSLSNILLLTLLVKCGLASLLISLYGMIGMALSTVFATVFWNILAWRTLHIKNNINPTIFGLFFAKKTVVG